MIAMNKKGKVIDPKKLMKLLWPDVTLYKQQWDIVYSIHGQEESGYIPAVETYAPAGNMLGKDYTAAFICLWFFLSRYPCRIVTTSAKDDHLRVLWGEIGQFISTSKYSLDYKKGGPLVINHQDIKRWHNGQRCPKSYLIGMVASADSIAAMQGHHIANIGDGVPRTLFVSDESSSVPDAYYTMAKTWFNRAFIFGNTWDCQNFWKRNVEAGDLYSEDGKRCYRRVIKIKAADSPNVRYAKSQIARGIEPTDEVLVPGVKSWSQYQMDLATLDQIKQCVVLDAEFYKGKELYLYPPTWLNRAEEIARQLDASKKPRKARAIGCDPAEGGDDCAWSVVDEYGLIELIAYKTPDTSVITGDTLALMRAYGVQPENVVFDAGGGGKEHVDRLRSQGYNVRTVGFGESSTAELKRKGVVTPLDERKDEHEVRYAYKNRRAEMYGILRQLLDPINEGFGIPAEYPELRRQLAPIPLWYDEEGRLYLPPKQKKADAAETTKNKVTMHDLIGCSPDEADSLVLAIYGMTNQTSRTFAGSI